ncbi:MAG: hypothetical protein ACJA2W_002125, partial [Planctomycetota bacterium]
YRNRSLLESDLLEPRAVHITQALQPAPARALAVLIPPDAAARALFDFPNLSRSWCGGRRGVSHGAAWGDDVAKVALLSRPEERAELCLVGSNRVFQVAD